MTSDPQNAPPKTPPREPSLRQILFDDVRASELPRSFWRDLRDMYRFYLDEEARAELASMGRLRRALKILIWTLKSLLLKLSPARRLMLAVSIAIFFLGSTTLALPGSSTLTLNLRPWGFLLLLLILMIELKDKLLARDEIELARQVQLALLSTRHPQPPGWAIWSHTRPANDVGGDLVDAIDLGSGSVGVVLGDVAGKGLSAALLMAKLQATLRAVAPECPSLDNMGSRLNGILLRDGIDNRFATLFYVILEPGSNRVRYLNAGHNPALVVRLDRVESLDAASRPLGMLAGGAYPEASVEISPGDLLVIYSDGLVEARGHAGEEFGMARLLRILPSARSAGAEKCGIHLLNEIDRFLGEERPHDDLSLVIVERLPITGAS